MRYKEILRLSRQGFAVDLLCRLANVSPSGFYSWKTRPLSKRRIEDEALKERIKSIFDESKKSYGVPRIRQALRRDGFSISKDRTLRLMKEVGITAKPKRKKKSPKTTIHKKNDITEPRIFDNEEVVATGPNQVWASDITYIHTKEGFLYLLAIIDLFSRRVVGWQCEGHMEESLLTAALLKALRARSLPDGKLVFHSDQGSQYCAKDFKRRLKLLRFIQSMSRRGNCYDNAHVESFWGRMKTEIGIKVFETKAEAREAIFDYIEGWYNTKRLHSSLGYLSPIEYEQQHGHAA